MLHSRMRSLALAFSGTRSLLTRLPRRFRSTLLPKLTVTPCFQINLQNKHINNSNWNWGHGGAAWTSRMVFFPQGCYACNSRVRKIREESRHKSSRQVPLKQQIQMSVASHTISSPELLVFNKYIKKQW